jgi:bacterial leucyl aminopeptidase
MALVEVIYFDLGDTLGVPVFSPAGRLMRFDAFGFSRQVLERLASWHLSQEPPALPLRLGVISNTGNEQPEKVNQILNAAGLLEHFDPNLLIYKKKDSALVFRGAADVAGLAGSEDRCLFVGEDAIERSFAMDAGFRVCPHPLLAEEVLSGQPLFYVSLRGPSLASRQQWQNHLHDLSVVPIHASGAENRALYVIASKRAISKLVDMEFQVTPLGEPNAPLRTEAYLLRDDHAVETGAFVPIGEASKFLVNETGPLLLHAEEGEVMIALPAEVPLNSIHFDHTQHGHTIRLMPKPDLLSSLPVTAIPSALRFTAGEPMLLAGELDEFKSVTGDELLKHIRQYSGETPPPSGGAAIASRNAAHDDNARALSELAGELEEIGQGRLTLSMHQFSHQGQTLHNLEAELAGDSPELVLVTAHFDSTAAQSRPYRPHRDPAPGADDDMSGIAAILSIAKRFISLSIGRTLPRTVRLVAFNAEEDGLVGSQAYARQLRAVGASVAGVFQMDMIGTNKTTPRTWEIHIGCQISAEAEARSLPLAELLAAVARDVSPGLEPAQICPTPDDADQRSDHSSFQVVGYGACCVSEDLFIGPGANAPPPDGSSQYHQSSDKAEHINADYAALIAGAVGAAAWKLANLPNN